MRAFLVVSIFLMSLTLQAQSSNSERLKSITEVKRFAFASCNKEDKHQVVWKGLIKDAPDFFIWGGDNVYADTWDPRIIKAAYDLQNSHPDYILFKSISPIIGIWDDHDFGHDASGGNFPHKDISQRYALDFFEEPTTSLRRLQKGIYTSYDFGKGSKKIKVILLDNRYFKDVEREAPLLGKNQWRWLEEELKNSTANMHFIVSSITITKPWYPIGEEWRDYSKEINRLFYLFEKYKPKGLLLMSGDKHFANIHQRLGYLEFLSSGMTHTVPFGVRKFLGTHYGGTSFFGLNYGLVEIDWLGDMPKIKLHIKDRFGSSMFVNEYHWANNDWVRDDIPE